MSDRRWSFGEIVAAAGRAVGRRSGAPIRVGAADGEQARERQTRRKAACRSRPGVPALPTGYRDRRRAPAPRTGKGSTPGDDPGLKEFAP